MGSDASAAHFGKTSRTLVDALADDPVARYRRETPVCSHVFHKDSQLPQLNYRTMMEITMCHGKYF